MEKFDHINEPPGQIGKMIRGMTLAGATIILMFSVWIFFAHNKNTERSDHEGHFACLFFHENLIFFAFAFVALLIWASGTDR